MVDYGLNRVIKIVIHLITAKYIYHYDYNKYNDTMLKTNDIQINKVNLEASNISVTFEDSKVHTEHYNFLKNRLNTFKFYINSEYSLKSEIQYDESSQLLTIGLNIIIPNQYLIDDPNKTNEILMEPVNTFQLFYDAQNEIYKRKQGIINF